MMEVNHLSLVATVVDGCHVNGVALNGFVLLLDKRASSVLLRPAVRVSTGEIDSPSPGFKDIGRSWKIFNFPSTVDSVNMVLLIFIFIIIIKDFRGKSL